MAVARRERKGVLVEPEFRYYTRTHTHIYIYKIGWIPIGWISGVKVKVERKRTILGRERERKRERERERIADRRGGRHRDNSRAQMRTADTDVKQSRSV